ncbi:hypothetical protein [Haliangium sp.]|uniref:hypothetical protein n=1 Tax=Haliangium sp. TaxID=2663208 RepID=UPI003D10BE31
MPSTNTSPLPRSFRFRPRFRALATGASALGAALIVYGAVLGGPQALYAVLGGALGLALGALYLISPAWRLTVTADEDGLVVERRGRPRLKLAWTSIVRVVASPDTATCFVDGGDPACSLLVPGVGASAPYDIEDKAVLCEIILARVAPERIERVELLEASLGERRSGAAPDGERVETDPAQSAK